MGYWQVGLQIPEEVRKIYMVLVETHQTSQSQLVSKLLIELSKRSDILEEFLDKNPPRRKRTEKRRSSAWSKPQLPVPVAVDRTNYHKHKAWRKERLGVLKERVQEAWLNPGTYLLSETHQKQAAWFLELLKEEKPEARKLIREWKRQRRCIVEKWRVQRELLCETLRREKTKGSSGVRGFRQERLARALTEFDHVHRLVERPLFRLLCEYQEARINGEPLDPSTGHAPQEIFDEIYGSRSHSYFLEDTEQGLSEEKEAECESVAEVLPLKTQDREVTPEMRQRIEDSRYVPGKALARFQEQKARFQQSKKTQDREVTPEMRKRVEETKYVPGQALARFKEQLKNRKG